MIPRQGTVELNVSLQALPTQLPIVVVRRYRGAMSDRSTGSASPGGDRTITATELTYHPQLAEPDFLRAVAGGDVGIAPETPGGLHVRGGSPDQTGYAPGTVVTLTPQPAVGWHFVNWGGDANGGQTPLSVTMSSNKAIVANFALDTFTLSLSSTGDGTAAKAPNQTSYNYGSVVTLTATPGAGNQFLAWGGDTAATANPMTAVRIGGLAPKSCRVRRLFTTYPLTTPVKRPSDPMIVTVPEPTSRAITLAGLNLVP